LRFGLSDTEGGEHGSRHETADRLDGLPARNRTCQDAGGIIDQVASAAIFLYVAICH